LAAQGWNREKSLALAEGECVNLTDERWAVLPFMRSYYLQHGLPINARTTARVLGRQFSAQSWTKFLHRLFTDGPVTQGSRLAKLPTQAYASDPSFGSSY
jgi:tRNA 2-thiouridine synthesizing protein E